ncbi:MAG: antibiotic biosynthesis monooxygenase [Cyanobacteria bacterium J06626_23]
MITPDTAETPQTVTAVITHLVKPDQVVAYEQWLRDVSAVAQTFAGHAGVSFVRPPNPTHSEYAIILKFDCYQNLKQWMDSPVRQQWIDKVQPLVQREQDVQVLTGLETWFTLPGRLVQQPPKRYKMAILTALAVFVVSQIISRLLGPLVPLPPLLRSLVFVTITVFALTYVVMPRVTRLFYRWLYPNRYPRQA